MRAWRAKGRTVVGALVVAAAVSGRGEQALGFLLSPGDSGDAPTTRASRLLLHASRGDPSSSSRPSRIPPRFRSGYARSSPPPSNNIGGAEFDSSGGGGGGRNLGARRASASSSPQPAAVRSAVSDAATGGFGGSEKPALQERLQTAPTFLREKVIDLREGARDRVLDIQESFASATRSINSEYVAPLAHLARNPSTIHYSAAISARLSYFMAQQSIISSTVGGKFSVDPIALSRAVLAALAGGREEPILDAVRIIPDERITSTENYAWWSRNLNGIVAVMKREAISIEDEEYKLPYDMRLTEAMGLLRYNPAKMLVAFSAYYRDELERKMWGMGDAMRRRSIMRVGRALADKDPETASLLDVGCGTGRFLTFVKNNFKILEVTALDLSLFNLRVAKQNLKGVEGVSFVESNAEHMTVESESQDVVTCNFVLSTMPKEAQANVINEIARTLKPGGKAIIVDATQPEFDGAGVCTLDGLPSWGEMTTTYRSYLTFDLEYSLIKAGLFVEDKEINWVSKVIVAKKPPRLTAPSTHGRLMGVGS